MNTLKEEILSIACDLKEGSMSLHDAEIQLKRLLLSSTVRIMKGKVLEKSGFTHSNRNHLKIEITFEQNYISNNVKVGDVLDIYHL